MADLRAALRVVRRRCVHAPLVTVVAIVAVLATAVHEGVFHHELALDVAFRYGFSGRAIAMGHWSTVATSQFLTRDPFMAISIALSLALMLGVYEMVPRENPFFMMLAQHHAAEWLAEHEQGLAPQTGEWTPVLMGSGS